jgi:hypothetical protein
MVARQVESIEQGMISGSIPGVQKDELAAAGIQDAGGTVYFSK